MSLLIQRCWRELAIIVLAGGVGLAATSAAIAVADTSGDAVYCGSTTTTALSAVPVVPTAGTVLGPDGPLGDDGPLGPHGAVCTAPSYLED